MQYQMKFLILTLVTVIACCGCQEKKAGPETVPRLKTATVSPPEGMIETLGPDATGGLLNTWEAIEWSESRFRPNVTFSIHHDPTTGPTNRRDAENAADEISKRLAENLEKSLNTDVEESSLVEEGSEGVYLLVSELAFELSGIPVRQIQVHAYWANKHYMMIGTAANSEWEEWQPRFRHFYNSFEVDIAGDGQPEGQIVE
jgi:hypothetical protein